MNKYQKKKKKNEERKKHRKTKKIENKRKRRQLTLTPGGNPILIESFSGGFSSTYRIEGDGDYRSFLINNKKTVISLINKQGKLDKIKLSLYCDFYKKQNGGEDITSSARFQISPVIITEATDVEDVYNIAIEKLIESIDKFQKQGSGWIFERVQFLDIHIDKYNPTSAKSWIKLSKKIKNKKAIINLKNNDNQCFKWSVGRGIFLEDRDNERISRKLKEAVKTLNWDGLECPVPIDKIWIFEKNNPEYLINVYSYGYKDRFKNKDDVYPIRISDKPTEGKKEINLLFITDGKNNHYCWIKSLSRLLSSQLSKRNGARFFCKRCTLSFTLQRSLEKHYEYCKNRDSVKTTLPVGDKAQLTFKNRKHKMRVPFVIYADSECITKNIQTCEQNDEKSFTQQYQKHEPSGFCYMIKCCDDTLFPQKLVKITGENIAQRFIVQTV